MALSVVDLYAKILPGTNCKECGYLTCIAFAGMVVSEKLPLKNCLNAGQCRDTSKKCIFFKHAKS
jgi:Na+-translocating ferredoxin:NAD+ oxidoreductase RNF subunit RnfB